MGTTFSGKHTAPITLQPSDNPAVFDSTFDLELATGNVAGILGGAGTDWNLTFVAGSKTVVTASNSDAVSLALGSVSNAGTIQGGNIGVYIPGLASVSNTGAIGGHMAVELGERAELTNETSGVIGNVQVRDGSKVINDGQMGNLTALGPNLTIENSGEMAALSATNGVLIDNGGTIISAKVVTSLAYPATLNNDGSIDQMEIGGAGRVTLRLDAQSQIRRAVSGFDPGDEIIFGGVLGPSVTTFFMGGILRVSDGTNAQEVALIGNYTGETFHVAANPTGAVVTVKK